MADPRFDAPRDEPNPLRDAHQAPNDLAEPDDRVGRYDANLQLIKRRLADHNRTNTKPRWWWPGR